MNNIIGLCFLLIITSCKNIEESNNLNDRSLEVVHVKLKESGFPLEANVSFLSNLISANNKTYLAYELNIFNNYKASINL